MKRLALLLPVIAWTICAPLNAHAIPENVPEPSSFMLIGSGIAGLLGLWRALK